MRQRMGSFRAKGCVWGGGGRPDFRLQPVCAFGGHFCYNKCRRHLSRPQGPAATHDGRTQQRPFVGPVMARLTDANSLVALEKGSRLLKAVFSLSNSNNKKSQNRSF